MGDEDTQEQQEGSKRNKHVYERMSHSFRVNGIEKSSEQCRTKVKKLRQEFKKITDNHNQTENNRKKWKFYDRINNILGKAICHTTNSVGHSRFIDIVD